MKKKKVIMMAFSKGSASKDAEPIKLYKGVASGCRIIAINPTMDEINKIYGNDSTTKEPEYIGKDDAGVATCRLDFYCRTNPEKNNGIDIIRKFSLFLKDEINKNSTGTKVQVMNKYGESTWITEEDLKNKTIPATLSWFEPSGISPAYVGEEQLTAFLKVLLNIPAKSYKKGDGTVVELENKADAEARLDSIKEILKGNYSSLREILKYQPNNEFKAAFGIKKVEDKIYQDIFTKRFLKQSSSNNTALEKEIEAAKAAGAYKNTEFDTSPLHEFTVEPTTFSKEEQDDIPAAPEAKKDWFK